MTISDAIGTLIVTNFHLYLIQLWWSFFHIFVNGNVVNAQTWQMSPPPEKPHPATLIDINRMMSEGWKATIRTAPTGAGGGVEKREKVYSSQCHLS